MFIDPVKTTEEVEKIRVLTSNCVGYQMTITCLHPDGNLRHYAFTNNFKPNDMISSHAECGRLIFDLNDKAKQSETKE